ARPAASRSHAPRRPLSAPRHPGALEPVCSCRKYSAVTLIVHARRFNPGVKPARPVRTPMQPPELVNMFAVPFAFSRLQDHALLNPRLRRYILEQEGRGTEAANPRPLTQRNAVVFESHFNLFRDNEPAVQALKTFCWDQRRAQLCEPHDHVRHAYGCSCRQDAAAVRVSDRQPAPRGRAARAVPVVGPARCKTVRGRGRTHHRCVQLLVHASRTSKRVIAVQSERGTVRRTSEATLAASY